MRILQISTYDISGGAGRAAYRLHRGLRGLGHDCRMLVRYRDTDDRFVSRVAPEPGADSSAEALYLGAAIQGHYIDSHRTALSNTLFSFPYPGHDLSTLPLVNEAEVINLHWVAQYQSLLTLKRLFDLGKPVVWTFHDQWAFTGGCHYSAGCEEYQKTCNPCPQLDEDPFHLPRAVLKDRLDLFRDVPLTIVTPSRWMAECVGRSVLFRDHRIEVIPNALETDRFRPLSKVKARKKLGLRSDTVALLFGGVSGDERRKGFHKLLEAIGICLEDSRFRNLAKTGKVCLLCFGHANKELEGVEIPVKALGYLNSEKELINAYCAADLFILPSLEDNLPNTMLEAMGSGTPVVGFDVGGIPDGVKSGKTGLLVPAGDVAAMGRAILSLVSDPEKRRAMGKAARKRTEQRYRLEIQARAYADLYEDLIGSPVRDVPPRPVPGRDGWKEPRPRMKALTVPLETGTGPNFEKIHDQVLFSALKEFSAHAYKQWQTSEADRAARLKIIEKLGSELEACEEDRRARLKLVEQLGKRLEESETDRAARLDVIKGLEDGLRARESESAERLEVIRKLGERLDAIEADRAARLKVIEKLGSELEACEEDRRARLKLVEQLGKRLEESETDRAARLDVIKGLEDGLRARESESAERLEVIRKLGERLDAIEADRAARLKVIEKLGSELEACEEDRRARLKLVEQLAKRLEESEADRAARLDVIEKLSKQLEKSESDRTARLEIIERQEKELREIVEQYNDLRKRFMVRALHRLGLA